MPAQSPAGGCGILVHVAPDELPGAGAGFARRKSPDRCDEARDAARVRLKFGQPQGKDRRGRARGRHQPEPADVWHGPVVVHRYPAALSAPGVDAPQPSADDGGVLHGRKRGAVGAPQPEQPQQRAASGERQILAVAARGRVVEQDELGCDQQQHQAEHDRHSHPHAPLFSGTMVMPALPRVFLIDQMPHSRAGAAGVSPAQLLHP